MTTNDDFVHIREAYWSAGDKYKWTGEHSRTGVGIAVPSLRGDGYLTVVMDKPEGTYEIEKVLARELATKYTSFDLRHGTRLAVIPLDAFKKKEETLCGKPHNNGDDSPEACTECTVIKHGI